MSILKISFQKVCKSIYEQIAPNFGKYFKAEFDNTQEVVKINESLETVRTYKEVGLQNLGKRFKHIKKLVLISNEQGVNFKMYSLRQGEIIVGLDLQYEAKEIYADTNDKL